MKVNRLKVFWIVLLAATMAISAVGAAACQGTTGGIEGHGNSSGSIGTDVLGANR